ncbi:peptidoglycan-binding protein [Lacrimispora amygdalina]|uniref:Peptidoglycan-binding protein n=1 Tax=Lacrimispora amygdalina TaxID=253257 RepID=A0A3E2NEX5_9FIRM|nr:peptidoglycan-binding protein [Clostridium indicum]RFZ79562.1 peptidoglycan-binding protein [Clostridium indicum]
MFNIIKTQKRTVLFLAAAVLFAAVYGIFVYNQAETSSQFEQKAETVIPDENSQVIKLETVNEAVLPATESEAQEEPVPDNLKEGSEHPFVAKLQERLMELGFMENDEPTLFYGSVTANAIRIYQRQNNIVQDGIAGPETLASLFSQEAKYYAVSLGISGDDVKQIQNRLYELGYLAKEEEVTGEFNETTEKAVMKLQELNQLSIDGKVGRKTIRLLYSEEVKPDYLAYGEKNEVVLSAQKRLKSLGYLTTVPDGNYGKDTVTAVKQFQSRNDLVVDGYLGPSTRIALEQEEATPNGVMLREQGESVKRIQELLNKYGYLSSSNVTGYFGEVTEQSVKRFQKDNGLKADGSVGVQTLSLLTADKSVKAGKDFRPAVVDAGSGGGGKTVNGNVKAFIDIAASKVGSKYVWGSKGPNSFDCSGFVYWSLNQIGVRQSYLTSSGWRNMGKYKRISNYDDIKPGDIVVGKGHMGIAAESQKVIDASSSNGKVVYRQRTAWWRNNFIVAWRIFE